MDIEPLCEHPPVVAQADRRVQHPGQRLLGGRGKSEGVRAGAIGVIAGAATGAGIMILIMIIIKLYCHYLGRILYSLGPEPPDMFELILRRHLLVFPSCPMPT